MNYGFIGFGNLAKAIHKGLQSEDITFGYVSLSGGPSEVRSFATIPELALFADVIWLCVKPQNADEVLTELKNADLSRKLIVSPMAGKTITYIEERLGKNVAIVRIMPNLAIAYQKSVTAYTTNGVPSVHELALKESLAKLGDVVDLPEDRFDLFTALFGSGPAFLLEILSAFKTKMLEMGVSDEHANDLLLALVTGTATYFQNNKDTKSITELIGAITSKGGTTEAGLNYFRNNNIGSLLEGVVETAEARGKELGK